MDIVERLRTEPELTPAQYWEAQADMWHQNYKEATNEIEKLRDALRWAAPYVQDDPRVSAIIKAALKEGE